MLYILKNMFVSCCVCFIVVSLVQVPATEGEFESSMKDNAQTREHATLLKALVSRQKNLLQTYHIIVLFVKFIFIFFNVSFVMRHRE